MPMESAGAELMHMMTSVVTIESMMSERLKLWL